MIFKSKKHYQIVHVKNMKHFVLLIWRQSPGVVLMNVVCQIKLRNLIFLLIKTIYFFFYKQPKRPKRLALFLLNAKKKTIVSFQQDSSVLTAARAAAAATGCKVFYAYEFPFAHAI